MSSQEMVTVGKYPLLHPYGAGTTVANENHPQINYDDYLVSYQTQTYAVFDGVGERASSHDASRIAVQQFYEHYSAEPRLVSSSDVALSGMRRALTRAHGVINANTIYGQTTAAALHLYEDDHGLPRAAVGHSGDSRVYRLREGWRIGSLTLDNATDGIRGKDANNNDSSWALQNKLSSASKVTDLDRYDLALFARRNLISTCLGNPRKPNPEPYVRTVGITENDRFVLTTDGIHDNLTTDEIEEIVKGEYEPGKAAADLIAAAQDRSRSNHMRAKPDDMTAVVVNVPRLG